MEEAVWASLQSSVCLPFDVRGGVRDNTNGTSAFSLLVKLCMLSEYEVTRF